MGQRTRASIVAEGLGKAGDVTLTSHANIWLNEWLMRQAKAFPWPNVQRSYKNIALGAGVQVLTIGNGNGGVSEIVSIVRDPLWLYTSDYSIQIRPRIRQLIGGQLMDDERVGNPLNVIGTPGAFKVRQSQVGISTGHPQYGTWDLLPWPVPDRAYLMAMDLQVIPALIDETIGGAGDSVVPWYPADRTMIHLVMTEALRWMKRMDEYGAAQGMLDQLTAYDRMTFGTVDGTNDNIGLDPAVFATPGIRFVR